MASVKKSRFALLKIDDDFDEEEQSSNNKQNGNKKSQQQAQAKKKNKKKKKAEQSRVENDELRNMAFGKSSAKKRTTSTSSQGGGDGATEEQWDEWRRLDEGFAQGEYEKNLQHALLASKLEFEKKKQNKDSIKGETNGVAEGKKGRKKKKEPKTMSLQQFNEMESLPPTKVPDSDDSDEEVPLPVKPEVKTEVSEPDPTFFDNVQKDVSKIIQKEKLQEQYRQQYAIESKLSLQYQEDIANRDKQIEALKKTNKEFKTEWKQAKERNQQLCHILSQGEMKNKSKILTELEELRRVNSELTQEVAHLNESLEKERSKVHQLSAELSKQKGGKHAAAK